MIIFKINGVHNSVRCTPLPVDMDCPRAVSLHLGSHQARFHQGLAWVKMVEVAIATGRDLL